MKNYITAGIAVRRQIRRFLLSEGINFVEDKAWLNSVFYLNCSDKVYRKIINSLEDWVGEKIPLI